MAEYVDDPNLGSQRETREHLKEEEIKVAEDAKAFLIGRTQEYVTVPVVSGGSVRGIEIRARLSRKEEQRFTELFSLYERALAGDSRALDGQDHLLAEFLAYITKDASLDVTFWESPELDEEIARTILLAYFTQPAANMARIWKFRNM